MIESINAYHFNLGQTPNNPLGLCAVVRARSVDEACAILNDYLAQREELSSVDLHAFDANGVGLDYIALYSNTLCVTAEDIDSTENAACAVA